MSGRKYIGEVVFNKSIDQYSKSKKDSLKREIYEKMVRNEYFIKNINVSNKTIKLKGNKAFVEFKETISPFNDTYKKRNKDKSMFNWAQKNFKRSMNFNKKMFLDDSLKAVKISVKKDNKTKKRTRKHKKNMNGGFGLVEGGLTALGVAGAYGYKRYKDKKRQKEENKLLESERGSDTGFTVGSGQDFIPLRGDENDINDVIARQQKELNKIYDMGTYIYHPSDPKERGRGAGFYKQSPRIKTNNAPKWDSRGGLKNKSGGKTSGSYFADHFAGESSL